MTEPPEKIIDLGEALRKSAEDDFWAIRGKAIQAYANLEQSSYRRILVTDWVRRQRFELAI
jgi:hypothetical protein